MMLVGTGSISTEAEVLALVEQQHRNMLEDFSRRHAVAMVGGKAVVVYRERDAVSKRMTTCFSSTGDIRTQVPA